MTRETVLGTLRRAIVSVIPEIDESEIDRGRTLAEIGCNSIDRAEIVTLAMEELEITVPLIELRSGSDIGTLADIMLRHA